MQRPPFFHKVNHGTYAVLAAVSSRYSSLPGRLSTRYSPVRHFTRDRSPFHVRLACVKHAASVQSEPESNSPVEKYWFREHIVLKSNSKLYSQLALHLSKNRAALSRRRCFMHPFALPVNNFFEKVFSGVGTSVPQRVLFLCPYLPCPVNYFFYFFADMGRFVCNMWILLNKFYTGHSLFHVFLFFRRWFQTKKTGHSNVVSFHRDSIDNLYHFKKNNQKTCKLWRVYI